VDELIEVKKSVGSNFKPNNIKNTGQQDLSDASFKLHLLPRIFEFFFEVINMVQNFVVLSCH